MGKSRRKHSREFKVEAVKQIFEKGRSVSDVAEGLGIHANMLSRWKTELESEGAVAFGAGATANASVTRPVPPPITGCTASVCGAACGCSVATIASACC